MGPTLRLLVIAMPVCILMVAFVGWTVAGMTLAGGLLLGAIMAPTDPVLAGDVQVGPPHEGGEHPVRFTLTTEAGLNDGLAFPFVHLGILIATAAASGGRREWIARDPSTGRRRGGGAAGLAARQGAVRLAARECAFEDGSGVIACRRLCLRHDRTCRGLWFIALHVGYTLRRLRRAPFHRRCTTFPKRWSIR
jgi:hypothetical protein